MAKESGVYEDIYDRRMWTEFLNPDGVPFLSLPYNFAFFLNVEWFQPFKHTKYACGAVYLAILNLPRPGPKEPELTINTFLEPLVDELLQLWNGVVMRTHNSSVLVAICTSLCGMLPIRFQNLSPLNHPLSL